MKKKEKENGDPTGPLYREIAKGLDRIARMKKQTYPQKEKKVEEKILVLVESPYAGGKAKNIRYARACINDCLKRGECPFASHIFYTQTGILDDDIPEERELGIKSGLAWGEKADKTIVYTDFGISSGMKLGIEAAEEAHRPIEYRTLAKDKLQEIINNKKPIRF